MTALSEIRIDELSTAVDRIGIPRALKGLRDGAESRLTTTEGVANAAAAAIASGLVQPAADLAALGALSVTALSSGVACFVRDPAVRDFFVLDKTGTWTVDGVGVIAAAGAAGYWVAERRGRWDDLWC